MKAASFFRMLPCVKSFFSDLKGSSPFAKHLMECIDGADSRFNIRFRDALQAGD